MELRDELISEEDLALRELTQDVLLMYWDMWLEQARATHDLDNKHLYSHGGFIHEPPFDTTETETI